MANLKGMESREVRGRILKILKVAWPSAAGDHLISETLKDAQYSVSPAEVQGHLEYLREKDYIELDQVEAKELDFTRNIAKLTPKGIDLLEENIEPDPGVMI